MTNPVSATRTQATDMFRFMTQDQLDNTAKVAKVMGCTFEAAVAIQLCRQVIGEYCPPDEVLKVVAALVVLYDRKASA